MNSSQDGFEPKMAMDEICYVLFSLFLKSVESLEQLIFSESKIVKKKPNIEFNEKLS